jgi:citrate lyase subunit beta/citryl-CoA lyase
VSANGAAAQGARMRLRSLLFVPGDRPERMDKALGSGADALILDLEDSVAASRKAEARSRVAEFLLRTAAAIPRFVRINPLTSGLADADLEAVMPARPDGLVLPKSSGAQSVRDLDRRLARFGKELPPILPIATETPQALFALGEYAAVASRLAGLTWGVEDLSALVGSGTARESDEEFTEPYRLVRALALFAAAAAAVAPIETVFPAFHNLSGLAQYARRGMRDGFAGMLAIHPTQIAVINEAFTPSAQSLEQARAVVALFAANPGAGALSFQGAMLDAPHLQQALRLLKRAEE